MALAQTGELSLKAEIEGAYARWNALTAAGNVEGLIQMLHRDFSYTDAKGVVEQRSAFGDRLREAFSKSRNLRNTAEILKVEGSRKKATAWAIYGVKMEYKQGEAWVPVEYKLKTQDTFIKGRDSWLLLRSKVLPQ